MFASIPQQQQTILMSRLNGHHDGDGTKTGLLNPTGGGDLI